MHSSAAGAVHSSAAAIARNGSVSPRAAAGGEAMRSVVKLRCALVGVQCGATESGQQCGTQQTIQDENE